MVLRLHNYDRIIIGSSYKLYWDIVDEIGIIVWYVYVTICDVIIETLVECSQVRTTPNWSNNI